MDAKSFLDNLLKGSGDLGQKAMETWDQQSPSTKGALAGGLLGVLMGGRGGVSGVVRVGGAALIGSLATRAYSDWQAGKDPLAAVADALHLGGGSDAMTEDFATRLLQAVVAAAKADGRVTAEEHARISAQMDRLELDAEGRALIEAELARPLDLDHVAALAQTPDEATQIYATTLLLVDPVSDRAYLEGLAEKLNLDPDLVAHLKARAKQMAA